MAPKSLSVLPLELLQHIMIRLTFEEKRYLSATNSSFRKLLMSEIFQALKLTNEEHAQETVLAIAEKYGQHVKVLCFEGLATPALDKGKSETKVRTIATHEKTLPPTVAELLSGKHLPNLHTIRIHFPADPDSGEWEDGRIIGIWIMLQDTESDSKVREAEAQHTWRALMAETYRALSSNSTVKKLVLDGVIPKATSTFQNKEWHNFLGRLETFDISVRGFDNGAGWCSSTCAGYMDFFAKFDVYFLNHLQAVKSLKLVAEVDGPIGLRGYNHEPLALEPSGQMPQLEHLELENMFIGPELVDFLLDHSQSLAVLRLKRCMSSSDEYTEGTLAEDAITWAEFFSSLRRSKPPLKLRELTIERIRMEIPEDDDDEELSETTRQVREILKSKEHEKIFDYRYLQDKYGWVFAYDPCTLAAYQEGIDYREYEKLTTIVAANARAVQGNIKIAYRS